MDNRILNQKFHLFVRDQELTKKWKKRSSRTFFTTINDYQLHLSLTQPRNSWEKERLITLLVEIVFPCLVEPDPMHRFDVSYEKGECRINLALLSNGLVKLNQGTLFTIKTEQELDDFFTQQKDVINSFLSSWLEKYNNLNLVLSWYKTLGEAFWVDLLLNNNNYARKIFVNFMKKNKTFRVNERLAQWLCDNEIINEFLKKELYIASMQSEDVLERQLSIVLGKIAVIEDS